jgi:hypothetical protein
LAIGPHPPARGDEERHLTPPSAHVALSGAAVAVVTQHAIGSSGLELSPQADASHPYASRVAMLARRRGWCGPPPTSGRRVRVECADHREGADLSSQTGNVSAQRVNIIADGIDVNR